MVSLSKLLGAALGTVHIVVMLLAMFINCNILVLMTLLLVAPFMPRWHHRLASHMFGCAFRVFVSWAQRVGGLRPIYYGPGASSLLHYNSGGSKLVIGNHLSYTDTFLFSSMAYLAGENAGMRAFAKAALRWQIPVVGWAASFLNFIFLSRNFESDKINIAKQVKQLCERSAYYSSGNFWLTIFPEGTRARPSKIKESQEFAKSRGLPVLKHVLLPRTKGLLKVLGEDDQTLRESVDGILDVTFGYPSKRENPKSAKVRPSIGDIFFDMGKTWPVHIYVRVIPMTEVPTKNEDIEKWIVRVFEEKDKLLKYYYKHGKFEGPSNVANNRGHYTVLPPGSSWIDLLGNSLFFIGVAANVGLLLQHVYLAVASLF